MNTLAGRRRSIGLVGGALWMIAISIVFITWSLLAIATPIARQVLLGSFVLLGVLVAAGVVVLRGALALPASTTPRSPEEQLIGRRFAWVFGAEMIAFAVVNSTIAASGDYALIPSLNLIVVGIHFFPLARIFRVPRYNVMGLLFCAIPIVTLLAISKQWMVGQALAWYVVPSLGCGFVASLTAAAGLREAWKCVSESRSSAV
ncbi:MAG: hypothetical protein NTZ35_10425 [Ignavibacteriales bacterium]|nr:hypothetical protein [Ignavibacteriales bacterium]